MLGTVNTFLYVVNKGGMKIFTPHLARKMKTLGRI